MKSLTVALGAVLAVAFMVGCATSAQKKFKDKEAKELLAQHQDIVLSGVTGAIKGSGEDAKLLATASPTGDYPKESLRFFLIEEFAPDLDPDCLAALKARKDVVIDGKTGELQGCDKGKNPGKLICPKCGFPVGSLRQQILVGKNTMWED